MEVHTYCEHPIGMKIFDHIFFFFDQNSKKWVLHTDILMALLWKSYNNFISYV